MQAPQLLNTITNTTQALSNFCLRKTVHETHLNYWPLDLEYIKKHKRKKMVAGKTKF